MEKVTTDTILDNLKLLVESKKANFDAHFWIETGLKLNLLLGDEEDLLVELHQKLAQLKLIWLESQEKINVSEVKLRTEASDEFTKWKKQDLRVKRIYEFIKLTKKNSDRSAGY